jgi:hypothetical protein
MYQRLELPEAYEKVIVGVVELLVIMATGVHTSTEAPDWNAVVSICVRPT